MTKGILPQLVTASNQYLINPPWQSKCRQDHHFEAKVLAHLSDSIQEPLLRTMCYQFPRILHELAQDFFTARTAWSHGHRKLPRFGTMNIGDGDLLVQFHHVGEALQEHCRGADHN